MLQPFLSGTLAEVIKELADSGNMIAAHILEINRLVEDALLIKYQMSHRLCDAIEHSVIGQLLTGEVSMLSVRIGGEDANISFLPKDKEAEYTAEGTWARKNRQEGKPAKIFQKAIVKEFKQQDWEVFSNAFKATVCNCNKFELVSGEQIRYWYNANNYYQVKGTLGNSCMRYDECSGFFDLYVDHAKMLISLKDGKLTGRAIVWEIDGKTYLDRIYTCYDYLYNCFIEYAKEHGWAYRESNSLLSTGDEQYWLTPDDGYDKAQYISLKVDLDRTYELFPYVDSLRYFNSVNNFITTDFNDDYCPLDRTDGGWDTDYVECEDCGRRFRGYDEEDLPEELHWSEWGERYLCDNCCYYCDFLDDYIPNEVSNTTVYEITRYGERTLSVPDDTLEENTINDPNDGSYGFVKINDKWYLYDSSKNFIKFNGNAFEIVQENQVEQGAFNELQQTMNGLFNEIRFNPY